MLILVEETGIAERHLILTVVTWTVALSVFAHGITAAPAVTDLIRDGRGSGPARRASVDRRANRIVDPERRTEND
ncbi:MAG TPA: hypothetical protein VHC18_27785 [Amycolatopsis sp.]|nr:hypothetical protein [Amycolatopsis sp.]